MSRAQITARPVLQTFFIIAAVMILIFGGAQITQWVKTSKSIGIINLQTTLKNAITKQAMGSYGSVDEKVIAISPEIEQLCFVDRKKEISPLVNCNLNPELNKYPNKNIFFEPFHKHTPINILNFELDPDENPLCLQPISSTVQLSLVGRGNRTKLGTFRSTEKTVDCVSVLYNSPPNHSVDIVFLPFGYNKFDDFRQDVNKNIQTFIETPPFNSSKEKLNFYRIDKLDHLDCKIEQWIKCDEYEVKKLASYCPHDYIIILADRNKVKDLINPVRSSAVSNMEKINTADNKLVVLHEFGHIFGELADEYVDEKYYSNTGFDPEDYPNCDLPPECKGWKNVEETGCFEGCSLKKFARPTTNSIMRSLNTEKFGPVNEKILIDKLNEYGD